MLSSASRIVRTLQAAGHTAYFTGGAVRDLLLDRKISDVDIATSAKPAEVAKLFVRTHPLGERFGVMLVVTGRHVFEVATFRGESDYDGRRPGKVFFTSAEADARRRDFTINGLFYDPLKKKVLDFVHGQHDLKLRVIRFIGDPVERVREDHLRLLRAVRFHSALDFEYEPKTAKAVRDNAGLISKISVERIHDELNKMLMDQNRAFAIRDLDRFGLLALLLPELTRLRNLAQPIKWHQEGDTFTHSLASLAALPANISSTAKGKSGGVSVAWATLLHDIGKAETQTLRIPRGSKSIPEISFPGHAEVSARLTAKILRRLKFDKATEAKTVWLVQHHMSLGQFEKMRPAYRHRYFMHPWFADLTRVWLADIRGTRPSDFGLYRRIVRMWRTETSAKLLPAPKTLLTGTEIIHELSLPPGPEIGRLKRILTDAQVEGLVKTRAEAVRFLEKCLRR